MDIQQELDILRRKRGEIYILRDTLRRLEWCAEYEWGTGCYFCGELRSDGVHKESCRWKLVMGE